MITDVDNDDVAVIISLGNTNTGSSLVTQIPGHHITIITPDIMRGCRGRNVATGNQVITLSLLS